MRLLLSGLFLLTTSLSIFLVRGAVAGIPLRGITAMLLLAIVIAWRPTLLTETVRKYWFAFAVIAATAALGMVVTLFNATGMSYVARQILEIHVQAAIGIVICSYMVAICGWATVIRLFSIPICISILFAAAQFAGFEPAWSVRAFLGRFQPEEPVTQIAYVVRDRTMGLSYSPTHVGTQSCLLFAAWFAKAAYTRGWAILRTPDRTLIHAAMWVVLSSVATGNRSPLLGLVGFGMVYGFLTLRARFVPFALVGGIGLLFASEIMSALQQLGLRIGSTDDGSAQSRTVLQVYGLYLFLDQPFGYGFSFDSRKYYWQHWGSLQNFPNPDAIMAYALHNYYLNVLNKYGMLLLPIAAVVARQLLRHWRAALAFIPYAVHIFFHNDGPLQGDFLIFFILPLFMDMRARIPLPKPARRGTRPARPQFGRRPRTVGVTARSRA